MHRRLGAALVAALALAACGGAPAATAPAGLVLVTAGGAAITDGADDVPPTLDLRIAAGRPLTGGDVAARLDGHDLALRANAGALTASVPPLPLGSAHRLDLRGPGPDLRHIGFRVVAAAAALAAVHADARDGFVLDLAFALAPDHAAVEAAVAGGRRTWLDGEHLRVAWPGAPGGVLRLPPTLPAEHGSHLAGSLTLDLGAVAPGTLRAASVPTAAGLPPHPLVVAFSVGTAASRASVAAHAAQISVLSPTGVHAEGDGSLRGEPDGPAVAAAAAAGLPVWPAVQNEGFDSPTVSRLLHDPAAVDRLVTGLRARAAAGGWGGVHLDLEAVPPDDRDLLSALVARLGAGLHADGRRLAVAVVPHKPGGLNVYSGAYDLAAIARAADLVTLMAYDQHTSRTDPGPVAALDWDAAILAGSLPDLNAAHTLLGLPLYARTWSSDGAVADGYAGALATALALPGARVDEDFDGGTMMVRAVDAGGGTVVAYVDDAASLARKMALVAPRGLAGVALWRLGFEDPALWALLPARAARPG